MLISASVRPRGLKRGVTDKKLGELLGFKEAVGLNDVCGKLELSADKPSEFFFLKYLYEAVGDRGNKAVKVTVEIDGKEVAKYWKDAEPAEPRDAD